MAIRKKKINYYNCKKLVDTECEYLMPLGMRSNGKSFAFREWALKRELENKELFIYLRRWNDDIKGGKVEKWFEQKNIDNVYGEGYTILSRSNEIWLAKYDEVSGTKIKVRKIGFYCALNEAERYKSWAVLNEATNIIYEEFITDKVYLDDEPTKLLQFVSTVLRLKRGRVILIGNTITQHCPYFVEWKLQNVLKQKQGTIDVYTLGTEEGNIRLAVENTEPIDYENKMYFGKTAEQIVGGKWETKLFPRRPKGKWETLYEIGVDYNQMFHYIMQLQINEKDQIVVFVYPSDRVLDRRVTDVFTPDGMITQFLNNNIKAEMIMKELWNKGKYCYSDDMVGTNFTKLQENYRFIR